MSVYVHIGCNVHSVSDVAAVFQGQNGDLESQYGRLQQKLQKMEEDHSNVQRQQLEEFNQMKQQNELEIATLKGSF